MSKKIIGVELPKVHWYIPRNPGYFAVIFKSALEKCPFLVQLSFLKCIIIKIVHYFSKKHLKISEIQKCIGIKMVYTTEFYTYDYAFESIPNMW